MTEIFFRLRIPDGFAPDDATQLILTRALETEAARLGVPLAGSMDVASSFVLGRRAWLLAYVAACARFGPVGFGHIRPWAELFAQGAGGAEAVRVLARAFDLPDGASSVAIASAMGATPERLRGWLSMRSAAAAGGMLSELFEAGYLMRIGSAPTGAMDGWHQQRARSCSYHVPSVDGMAAAAALSPDIIASAEHAASITAPRMRWGAHTLAYARPLRWIVALLDEEVIPFSVGPVTSGRETCGHRIHGPGPFSIARAADYLSVVAEKCAITVDPAARREIIVKGGNELAQAAGGKVLWRDGLLEEVQGLVEHPVPLLGDFDPAYLEVPAEVLLTSMEAAFPDGAQSDAAGHGRGQARLGARAARPS